MSYIANKHNMANITNIHYYDTVGGAWSANLLGVALPYNLLPAAPAAGDVVVFGIDTSLPDSGPFCSLVFDLMTAQNDLTTVTWRYSDAGVDPTAWGALNVQDNTDSDGAHTGDPFDTTGVKSVHWWQPSDWVDTLDPTIGGNALGVTGYWVCAHVSVVGAAPTAPVQQNRHPYTITWAFLEALAEDIEGDVPAFVSLLLRNQSDYQFMIGGPAPVLFSNRVLVGLRSYDRGSDYTCYINLSDEQNASGITVTDNPALYVFANDSTTPTGRKIQCTNVQVAPGAYLATISFTSSILRDFAGRYRLLMRVYQNGGVAGDITFYFTINFGYFFYSQWTPQVATSTTSTWELMDFGLVTLPPTSDILDSEYGNLYIRIWGIGNGATDIDLFDIILLPVDEWCADVMVTDLTNAAIMSGLGARGGGASLNTALDINSLVTPRRSVRSLLKNYASGQVMRVYSTIASGPPIAQANARQRFWFVQEDRSTDYNLGPRPEIAVSATVDKVQRYFSMRGGR